VLTFYISLLDATIINVKYLLLCLLHTTSIFYHTQNVIQTAKADSIWVTFLILVYSNWWCSYC